ncbi:unnamed protein product, partial [marine sediment metagenome]
LNSENYNVSSTIMSYEPADKSEVLSIEFVEFDFSANLSEMYSILGKVANKIGNIYKKSEDDMLKQLAKAYNTMEEEAKSLSELVKKQLSEYDKPINICIAMLRDDYLSCLLCEIACGIAIVGGCLAACYFFFPMCFYCFAIMYYVEYLHMSCYAACHYIGC